VKRETGKVPTFPPGGFGGQPYIVRSGEWVLAYYIGIIDFLQVGSALDSNPWVLKIVVLSFLFAFVVALSIAKN
jgi:hypothetical protein